MREIELCPGCYKLTVKQPKDWFCIPCVSGSLIPERVPGFNGSATYLCSLGSLGGCTFWVQGFRMLGFLHITFQFSCQGSMVVYLCSLCEWKSSSASPERVYLLGAGARFCTFSCQGSTVWLYSPGEYCACPPRHGVGGSTGHAQGWGGEACVLEVATGHVLGTVISELFLKL